MTITVDDLDGNPIEDANAIVRIQRMFSKDEASRVFDDMEITIHCIHYLDGCLEAIVEIER